MNTTATWPWQSPRTPHAISLATRKKFRELVFALVENFLINDGVENIHVTIASKQMEVPERHRLQITTVALGRDSLQHQANLLERPTTHPQVLPYLRHQHTMFRINRLLRVMKGALQTKKVETGIEYVASLHLTKVTPTSSS
ncbi:hypothetical protein ACFL5J_02750 [Thermodesulfobacteriota bacterium]